MTCSAKVAGGKWDPRVRNTNKNAEDLFSFAHSEPSSLCTLRQTEAKLNYELFNQKPFSELIVKPDLIPWNPESLSHALHTFACTITDSDIFSCYVNTNSVNSDAQVLANHSCYSILSLPPKYVKIP